MVPSVSHKGKNIIKQWQFLPHDYVYNFYVPEWSHQSHRDPFRVLQSLLPSCICIWVSNQTLWKDNVREVSNTSCMLHARTIENEYSWFYSYCCKLACFLAGAFPFLLLWKVQHGTHTPENKVCLKISLSVYLTTIYPQKVLSIIWEIHHASAMPHYDRQMNIGMYL